MNRVDPLLCLLDEWFPDCSDQYLAELGRQVEFAMYQREHPRARSYIRWRRKEGKR